MNIQNAFFYLISVRYMPYASRTEGNTPLTKTKHNFFKNSLFPSAIMNGPQS